MEVIVQDANNIVIEVDQGRQGRGISTVGLVTVGADYYLLFTFTDGSTEQVGPIAPIVTEVLFAEARNAEATTILKGQPVYLFQAQGNLATVKLAFNTSDATSAKTLGLAAENIAPGAQGLITCQGTLGGLNTSAYNEGDTLYLGATAGTLTNVKPQAPNHLVYIGVVERANAGAGQIYVRVQNGFELDEIHDVQINSPVNGNTLIYDASTSLWKNAGITAGTGVSVTNGPASITVGNTGVLSFSGGTTGLTPATATTGAVTLAGTLSTANGGTGLSSFTANRVLYASSTSAIGQSSNLTFDGTNLGLGDGSQIRSPDNFAIFDTSSSLARISWSTNNTYASRTGGAHIFNVAAAEQMRLTSTGLGVGTSSPQSRLQVEGAGVVANIIASSGNGNIRLADSPTSATRKEFTAILDTTNNRVELQAVQQGVGFLPLTLNPGGGNVGIGTTSPSDRFVVENASANITARISAGGSASYTASLAIGTTTRDWTVTAGSSATNYRFTLNYTGTDTPVSGILQITKDGNLGLGVTPSAWSLAGLQAFQVKNASLSGYLSTAYVSANAFYSGAWNYITTAGAGKYDIDGGSGGSHRWFIAPSGTAGTAISFTQAMLLDASGNLGLGVTPSAWGSGRRAIQIGGPSVSSLSLSNTIGETLFNSFVGAGGYVYVNTGVAGLFDFNNGAAGGFSWRVAPSGTAGASVSFTQAMTLNASSQLLVGTTTNTNSSTVTAGGTISETVSSVQYLVASQFDVGTAPNKIPLNQYLGNLAYQNASAIAGQVGFSAGTAALPSIASATDLTTGRWFPAAGVMAWSTSGVERMRLDALGNLGVGLTNPSARVHASAADAAYQLGISGTTRGIRVETNATESRIVGVDQTLISSFQPISIGGLQVVIRTNGTTEAARFNSSGNLALGNVTPSAWYTSPFIDIGQYGAIGNNSGGGGGFALYANAFEDTGGTFKYKQNYSAALYRTFAGAHQWFIAPSGTAGNAISFTQAMTLTATGELGVGTTNPSGETIDVLAGVKSGQIVASTSTNNGFAAIVAAVRDGGENRRAGLYVDDSNATWGLASKYSTTGADFVLVNNNARAVTANLAGSVIIGSAAIATTATDGFFYIPTCAGAPTGTPTAQTGRAPLVVDSTNNRFYVYVGGTWKYAALV